MRRNRVIILPMLTGPRNQIKEFGFSRDTCISLIKQLISLFQLTTQPKRDNAVTRDNPRYTTHYRILLPEETLEELWKKRQTQEHQDTHTPSPGT